MSSTDRHHIRGGLRRRRAGLGRTSRNSQGRLHPLGEWLEGRALLSTFAVDHMVDENDGNYTAGNLSLREAILLSNANPGADQIDIPVGTYRLAIGGSNEQAGRTGDLDIIDSVTISGAGAGATTIDGSGIDRIFEIFRNAGGDGTRPVVVLAGLNLTGGQTPQGTAADGGAINVIDAVVTVQDCTIRRNATGGAGYGGRGGGINVSVSDLTVLRSVIDGNRTGDGTDVGGPGGGIAGNASVITVRQSTVSNNATGVATRGTISSGRGGGIYSESGVPSSPGLLTVEDSTIADNRTGASAVSKGLGGGIYNYSGSALVLRRATVRGNVASIGGGVMTDNGTDGQIIDSTIVGNTADGGKGGGLASWVSRISLISGTTISGNAVLNANSVYNGGGGIYNDSREIEPGDGRILVEIVNSTIANNTVSGTYAGYPSYAVGGGILNAGDIGRITNTTIAGNTAREAGGLFHATYANTTPVIGELANTLIANNVAAGSFPKDFEPLGQVTLAENNLVEDPNGHGLTDGVDGNVVGRDPLLGALADNGGPTATMALSAGSPAVNAGRDVGAPATDQRGVGRPQGFAFDIGAFELVLSNRPPTANNLSVDTDEDTSASGAVTASDPEGDPLTFSATSQPQHGTLQFNADGTFTYTPAGNYYGLDGFTFTASDGQNTSSIAQVSFTVRAINDAPVADDVAITIDEDQTYQGKLTASDADGNPLTFSRATTPAHGVAAVRSDGTVIYIPRLNYNGADSFTYSVSDGQATTTRTIRITIRPVNDPAYAGDQAIATDEDTPYGGQLQALEVEGDPVTFALEAGPAHGNAAVNADGTFTYTPAADYNGADSFTFRTADDKGASTVGTITVKVRGVNDAPIARDDRYSVGEDRTLTLDVVAPISSLVMHSEPGDFVGQGLEYSFTTADAAFTGRTNSGRTALISISGSTFWMLDFAAADGAALTPGLYLDAQRYPFQAAGHPGLDVSGAGRGENQLAGQFLVYEATYSADRATLISFAARFEQHGITAGVTAEAGLSGTVLFNSYLGARGGVIANDVDVDDDLLRAILVSGPSHGSLSLNPDGSLNYTPDPDFHGDDSFTYKVNDGLLDSNTATVTITVNPANDAPVASPQALATDEDTPINGAVSASDADGNPLTYAVATAPTHGTLVLNADGTFTYTPAANYYGADSFTFTANDGQASSDPTTVTIAVNSLNDAPVGSAQALMTDEDAALAGSVSASDVDGGSLTYAVASSPTHGTLAFNADGTFTYTPAGNFNGADSFSFTASDGQATGTPATVTIAIAAVNDAPVADGGSFVTDEDATYSGSFTANDVDGDALSFALASEAAHGTVSINPDGTFTYTPDANYNGVDSFSFTASDGKVLSGPATVTIAIRPVNDPPLALGQGLTTDEDTPLSGRVSASDVEGDTLSYLLRTGPAHGTLAFNADGTFTYTPAANYYGADSFTFAANDGQATGAPATVAIAVGPVNDPPTLADAEFSIPENSANGTPVGQVLGSDVDGNAPAYQIIDGNGSGAFAIDPDSGRITVADGSKLDFEATPRFVLTIQATDPSGASARAAVTITLTDVDESGAFAIDILPGDADNTINIKGKGKLEVAILSSATFNARDVDVNSLRFGRTGAEDSLSRDPKGTPRYRLADVNGDGRLDLVVQFETEDTGFRAGDTRGILTGRTRNGLVFQAEDRIKIKSPGR